MSNPPLSIYECAVLAEDAYNTMPGQLPRSLGFRPFHEQRGTGGFFGRVYMRGDLAVFSMRGTEPTDPGDLRADLAMAPSFLRGSQSLPGGQTRAALSLFDVACDCMVTGNYVITGHSLGGALTKAIAHERSVLSAVSFNAPFIGGLRGINKSMMNLINVNTVGDPVSRATENLAGYFKVAKTYNVSVFSGFTNPMKLHSITPLRESLGQGNGAIGGQSATALY